MTNRTEWVCQTILIALHGYDDLFVSSRLANAKNLCLLGTTRNAVRSSTGATLIPSASLNDDLKISNTTQLIITDGYDQSVAVYIDPRIKSLVQRVRTAGGTVKAAPASAWQLGRFGIHLLPGYTISRGQFEPGKLERT